MKTKKLFLVPLVEGTSIQDLKKMVGDVFYLRHDHRDDLLSDDP